MPVRVKTKTYAPEVTGETLVYDADLEHSLLGLDILAPGTLRVLDIKGAVWTHTFTALNPTTDDDFAYSTFPYRLALQIKQIVGDGTGSAATDDSGTTIDLSDLIGLV